MNIIKIMLLTFVGIVVGIIPLYFMYEAEVDDDIMTPIGIVSILASIAIFVIPPFLLKIRSYTPVLQMARQQNPVAYFCSFPYETMPYVLTADEQEITIWAIEGKEMEKIHSFSKQHTEVTKGRVQVAAVRSVEGLVLVQKNKSNRRVEINICPDKLNILFSPKKGAELDEAIQRIKNGR